MLRLAIAVGVILALPTRVARADNTEKPWDDDATLRFAPLIPLDDTASQGPLATDAADIGPVSYDFIDAPRRADELHVLGVQATLGPVDLASNGQARRIFGRVSWLEDYSVRLRWNEVVSESGKHHAAPLTISIQRYFVASPLSIAPLIHLHAGVSGTFATPWLGDRKAAPLVALATTHAVDTELAGNGFDARLGGYVRADLMLCRNKYVELGAEPELFAPTATSGAAHQYLLRYHWAIGTSLRCSNNPRSWTRPFTIAYEMRATALVYAADADPTNHAAHGLVLQYGGASGVVVALRASRGLEHWNSGYWDFGISLQFGLLERAQQ